MSLGQELECKRLFLWNLNESKIWIIFIQQNFHFCRLFPWKKCNPIGRFGKLLLNF